MFCELAEPTTPKPAATSVTKLLKRYGGRYLTIGCQTEVVEGDWRPIFPVLIEFPWRSREALFDLAKPIRETLGKPEIGF